MKPQFFKHKLKEQSVIRSLEVEGYIDHVPRNPGIWGDMFSGWYCDGNEEEWEQITEDEAYEIFKGAVLMNDVERDRETFNEVFLLVAPEGSISLI